MAFMKLSSTTCYVAPLPSSPPIPQTLRCELRTSLPVSPLCSHQRRGLPSDGASSCRTNVVQARLGRTGGAGVLERPGLDQSQSGQEPRVEEGGEMGKLSQRRIFGGGDRYRVLLLDHEKHTEGQVASVLPKVVPTITADEARKCFKASREMGVGIVTVTVKEHAEFYAQMMARSGLRSGIEPDSDTI